jgi:hypothetical protein
VSTIFNELFEIAKRLEAMLEAIRPKRALRQGRNTPKARKRGKRKGRLDLLISGFFVCRSNVHFFEIPKYVYSKHALVDFCYVPARPAP